MSPEVMDAAKPAADATMLGLLAAVADPALWVQVAIAVMAIVRLVEVMTAALRLRKAAQLGVSDGDNAK